MVNRSLLSSKLAELADRVNRIRSLGTLSIQELTANRDAFDLASFNLMLAVQVCADVAAHLIADEGWPAAKNLAEAFSRLEEQGVLPAPVAQALRRAVGLRNVVAHGYARVDPAAIHSAATDGLAQLEAFSQAVASWAELQTP
jgi:uncharacterized protein YutE (UPF0331/DUF86 family)